MQTCVSSDSGGSVRHHVIVSMLFEFFCEGSVAAVDDFSVVKDVHDVGLKVVQHPVVVRDEEESVALSAQIIDTFGDGTHGVDIESGVGFIEEAELGSEQRQPQTCVMPLLP